METQKMKLSTRIKGRDNKYLEMPNNSEVHIVNKDNLIVLSITMINGKPKIWGQQDTVSRQKEAN